jgi:hypothetical protein
MKEQTEEQQKGSFIDLGDKEFFVMNGESKDGFHVMIDGFEAGTNEQPKISLRLAPLGMVHENWHMRVNLCGLSSLRIFPDGATFVDNPGDIYINAVTLDSVSTLAKALAFAVNQIQNHYGNTDNVQQASPLKKERGEKKEKLACSQLAKEKEAPEGFSTVLDKNLCERRNRGDGTMEEHGYRVIVQAKEKSGRRSEKEILLSLDTLGDVYQEQELKIDIAPLTDIRVKQAEADITSPGKMDIKLTSKAGALLLAKSLREAADAIEAELKK